MSNQKRIVLAKPADWDDWISLVRSRAQNNDIWHLVNPNLPERPQPLPTPVTPTFVLPPAGTALDKNALELYKLQNSLYKTQMGEYNRQKRAFGDLISFIQETISAHNITYIQKVDPYPWDMLRALKNRLAPSDHARSLEGSSSQVSMGNSGAFICTQSAFSAATWSLQNSWILDNGTNVHVCNSTMLSRFTKTRSSEPDDKLRAGNQIFPIECFGTIDIFINTPIGCQTMTLLNVAYIADFMTNLVSMTILSSKGVYFDSKDMHLYRDTGTFAYVENHNGHHLMENNTGTQAQASASSEFTTPISDPDPDSNLDLDLDSDLDLDLDSDPDSDLDPTTKITEFEVDEALKLDEEIESDKKIKSDEKVKSDEKIISEKEIQSYSENEKSYLSSPDSKHLTESLLFKSLTTGSLTPTEPAPEGVETQQKPLKSHHLQNLPSCSGETGPTEYLYTLASSSIPVTSSAHSIFCSQLGAESPNFNIKIDRRLHRPHVWFPRRHLSIDTFSHSRSQISLVGIG